MPAQMLGFLSVVTQETVLLFESDLCSDHATTRLLFNSMCSHLEYQSHSGRYENNPDAKPLGHRHHRRSFCQLV